jgi:predicted aldo/keto reductase-like oxidoreductase
VQTKIGPYPDLDQFAETFEKSMDALRLDYIDLLGLHGINNRECHEHALKCADLAQKWKEQGRIRHLGFSTHGDTRTIIDACNTGLYDYVNLHWYWIFQDNWPAIEAARAQDMGVFIISPSDKGGMLYKETEAFAECTAPYHPMVFNNLFCLSRPEVHTLSCGAAVPSDYDLHAESTALLDDAAAIVPPIERRLEHRMGRVLGEEWTRSWKEGLPDWWDVPGEVNIKVILMLYNLAKAFDMTEYGRMRYNLLGNGGHWFPGRNAGNVGELDLSECLRDSPHADVIPEVLAEAHALLKGEEVKRLSES